MLTQEKSDPSVQRARVEKEGGLTESEEDYVDDSGEDDDEEDDEGADENKAENKAAGVQRRTKVKGCDDEVEKKHRFEQQNIPDELVRQLVSRAPETAYVAHGNLATTTHLADLDLVINDFSCSDQVDNYMLFGKAAVMALTNSALDKNKEGPSEEGTSAEPAVFSNMLVPELKKALTMLKLSNVGLKADLVARLQAAHTALAASAAPAEVAVVSPPNRSLEHPNPNPTYVSSPKESPC
jgi:hypothetical protein